MAAIVLFCLTALLHSELPPALNQKVLLGVPMLLAAGGFISAHIAAALHQRQAPYLDTADRAEWERRQCEERLGFLAPFAYLLSSVEERKVGRSAPRRKVGRNGRGV